LKVSVIIGRRASKKKIDNKNIFSLQKPRISRNPANSPIPTIEPRCPDTCTRQFQQLLMMATDNNTGPILVKAAVPTDDIPSDISTAALLPPSPTLSVPLNEDLLTAISDNTTDLQDRLNKFVNGLTAKIQSVTPLSPPPLMD
jgi:hypothetical protein